MQGLLISITVALAVEVIDVALGIAIGVLAGYYGGWIDQVLARFTDVMFAFPGLLFAILLTGIFGYQADGIFGHIPIIGANGNARLILVSIALAMTTWPLMARYVRGQTLQLKEQQFVEAARTSGTSDFRIILRHIIPNLFSIVIIAATLNISGTIIGEAGIKLPGTGCADSRLQPRLDDQRCSQFNSNTSMGSTLTFFRSDYNSTSTLIPGRWPPRRLRPSLKRLVIGENINMATNLLEVNNLKTYFFTRGGVVKAVDDVSFTMKPGETLGVVGESGCGKSVTALSVMRLVANPPGKIVGGEINFNGENILEKSQDELTELRGSKISMIFQDPMTSLNPVFTVGFQIAETVKRHRKDVNNDQAWKRAVEMLDLVRISDAKRRAKNYPHEFSGGMRQRVMIAIALACNPQFLIADEPTTALDVTIQAQVLELMKGLSQEFGTAVMLITHDLGVVAGTCQHVNVMYAGHVVESAPVKQIFDTPAHPYTLGLLQSIPRLNDDRGARLTPIAGQPPDLSNHPLDAHMLHAAPRYRAVAARNAQN